MSAAGPQSTPEARTLGMRLFLASLSMLFAAGMVGHLAVRLGADVWPPEGWPGLPAGLWLSTVVLVVASFALHRALRAARAGRRQALVGWTVGALALGAAFLVSQVVNWRTMLAAGISPQMSLAAWTFFVLTALHGLHVIGGLAPLAMVAARARRGAYTPERHDGVRLAGAYWHFLLVVWLVMFAVLAV